MRAEQRINTPKSGKNEAEISVIVPVYKAEKYLDCCVESILNQTFSNIELILVDDGSPDCSSKICDEWEAKDLRVRVIHKDNGGASSARNAGIAKAKGEWIFFVDSDDWIELDAVRYLYNIAQTEQVQMVIGEVRKFQDGEFVELAKNASEIGVFTQRELLDRFFRINGERDRHSCCGTLISADILKGYHFIEGIMNEDVETCYYLARKCERAAYSNKPLYNYFVNNSSATHREFTEKNLDLLNVWNIVLKQTKKYTPEYTEACDMNCRRARFTLLAQMYINGYDKTNPDMHDVKKALQSEVRQSFWKLMKWRMPISRKILMLCLVTLP